MEKRDEIEALHHPTGGRRTDHRAADGACRRARAKCPSGRRWDNRSPPRSSCLRRTRLSSTACRPAWLPIRLSAMRTSNLRRCLSSLRFSVEKKSNGKSVLKVTSSRPVNDPFVDMLIELNWASGRLVREYTMLLDPPGMAPQQSVAPVAAVTPTRRARCQAGACCSAGKHPRQQSTGPAAASRIQHLRPAPARASAAAPDSVTGQARATR